MYRSFKTNLGAIAAVLAITAVFAFKPESKREDQRWYHVYNTETEAMQWLQGSQSGLCSASSEICTADFPEGYNPNGKTDSENRSNATTIFNDGLVIQ